MLPIPRVRARVPKNRAIEIIPNVNRDFHLMYRTEFQLASGIEIPNRKGKIIPPKRSLNIIPTQLKS